MEYVRRNRVLLTSAFLLLISILQFSVSVRTRPYGDPLAAIVLEVFAPLQGAVSFLQRGVKDLWYGYFNLVGARRENEMLRDRVAVLERDLVQLAEVQQNSSRLADLLRFRSLVLGPALGARVIARDPLPWFHTFTIDLGSADGVREGMAVLAPQGVVGRITKVSRMAARVMLLTDNNSGIDAVVQRSRARGIVQGTQDGGCRMNYLRRDVDVLPGDRVVTSGLDGIFPKGVVIGEIAGMTLEHRGLLQSATIHPSVQIGALEEVLIVDATVVFADPPA
jgi:rod shape-determining protein MreC